MKHTTEIVETKEANGQFAVKIRCCDDPNTDEWHTVAAQLVERGFDAQHRLAATHHDALLLARKVMDTVKGQKKENEV